MTYPARKMDGCQPRGKLVARGQGTISANWPPFWWCPAFGKLEPFDWVGGNNNGYPHTPPGAPPPGGTLEQVYIVNSQLQVEDDEHSEIIFNCFDVISRTQECAGF
jgi:hypothetical protein